MFSLSVKSKPVMNEYKTTSKQTNNNLLAQKEVTLRMYIFLCEHLHFWINYAHYGSVQYEKGTKKILTNFIKWHGFIKINLGREISLHNKPSLHEMIILIQQVKSVRISCPKAQPAVTKFDQHHLRQIAAKLIVSNVSSSTWCHLHACGYSQRRLVKYPPTF